MNVECHDDSNVVAKRNAAKEMLQYLWMLYLDHVDCSVVSEQL